MADVCGRRSKPLYLAGRDVALGDLLASWVLAATLAKLSGAWALLGGRRGM